MKTSRAIVLAVLLLAVAAAAFFAIRYHNRSRIGESIQVYYTKTDGASEVPWTISMRPPAAGESAQARLENAALYAASQAVSGPPANVDAVRFPPGTHVLSVNVTDATAIVDLSNEVARHAAGTFGENGEFKALVWTLTALPGIDAVAVRVEGRKLDVLPGGHLELDQPLHRSDW